MTRFSCPFLQAEVELTAERVAHIKRQHPEVADEIPNLIEQTIADPDEVRGDRRFPSTRLFSRWLDDLLRGKILVVAVVTDHPDSDAAGPGRHWVVTAYPTRRITQGDVLWVRP